MKSLYLFDDYRQYLRTVYEERKGKQAKFSHRFIEREVGLKSAGHFAQILAGKVNISSKVCGQFVAFLQLKKREAEYFELLVLYNQAKSVDERKRLFDRLAGFKEARFQTIGADRNAYFQKWYYSAVRELFELSPFKGDYAALGRMLSPAITAEEAKDAVELLLRLGFIRKRAGGTLAKCDDVVTTGYDTKASAIHAYQLEMIRMASQALDRFPSERRTFSTLTLSIAEDDYQTILEELRAFRRRVLDIARKSQRPDRVYQYNFQVFPLALPAKEIE
jgi:uncharacterized protein (TIGR02147 family)